jgi:hypothetical protein
MTSMKKLLIRLGSTAPHLRKSIKALLADLDHANLLYIDPPPSKVPTLKNVGARIVSSVDDKEALEQDWASVGQDIYSAINKYAASLTFLQWITAHPRMKAFPAARFRNTVTDGYTEYIPALQPNARDLTCVEENGTTTLIPTNALDLVIGKNQRNSWKAFRYEFAVDPVPSHDGI